MNIGTNGIDLIFEKLDLWFPFKVTYSIRLRWLCKKFTSIVFSHSIAYFHRTKFSSIVSNQSSGSYRIYSKVDRRFLRMIFRLFIVDLMRVEPSYQLIFVTMYSSGVNLILIMFVIMYTEPLKRLEGGIFDDLSGSFLTKY